jgi:6-phosphogluconolactonase
VNRFRSYADREALALALATGVSTVLAGAVFARGRGVLAVSGGSTPAAFFTHLSRADIAWADVTVTLVDERFVPPEHERSNLGMVRRLLLQGPAAAARMEPLHDGGAADAQAAAHDAAGRIALLGGIDACILGMGADGHTASFFPGGDRLAKALDPQCDAIVLPMQAPSAGEPRITLTLREILAARFLALHIEGEEKKRVYEQALTDGPQTALPVRAAIRGAGERLQVFWAP